MTTSFLEKPRLGKSFLKEPHLKRVVILRRGYQNWLIRHEAQVRYLSSIVWHLKNGIDFLSVQVPKYNVITSILTLDSTCQQTKT
jgi:hypothetical protein